jgi:hypothetical protein
MTPSRRSLCALALAALWVALATPALAQEGAAAGKKVRTSLRPATMMPSDKKATPQAEAPTKAEAPKVAKKSDTTKKAEVTKKTDEGAKKKPAPSKDKPTNAAVRVIGAYRPVDIAKGSAAAWADLPPAAQNGLDFYLSIEKGTQLHVGQEFSVFRRVAAPTVRRSTITLKVGELRVVGIEGALAVARVISAPVHLSHPYLKTPGVLVGDFIVSTRPLPPERHVGGWNNVGGADDEAHNLTKEQERREAEARALAEEEARKRARARALAKKKSDNDPFSGQSDAPWRFAPGEKRAGGEPASGFKPPGPNGPRPPSPEDKDAYRYWDTEPVRF